MTPRKAKAILTSCEKQIPQLLESEIHGVKSLTEGMIRKSPLVKVEEWNTRTLFGLSWAKRSFYHSLTQRSSRKNGIKNEHKESLCENIE